VSQGLRTWGLRLLALAIALAIWFSVSLDERRKLSEKVVEAGISYNRPRGYVILDPAGTVEVRLRGTEKAIRQLNPFMVDVEVDLRQTGEGPVTVNLTPDDVLTPDGIEVVSIQPNVIRVELDREISQRIPVEAVLVGEPAGGALAEEPEILPNQVLVTGPESLLTRIQTLKTEPISLDNHALTFEVVVPVVPPHPLIQVVQPSRVSVRIPMTPPGTTRPEGAEENSRRPS
jgi:YbbR domain-containing protein